MHLVDRHRRAILVGRRPPLHPFAIAEAVLRPEHARGGARRLFHRGRVRIGLEHGRTAAARTNFVLVTFARLKLRDEQLPDSGAAKRSHLMDPSIPAIEVADHANALGIRRPYREGDADDTAMLDRVRAELLVSA